MMYTSLIERLHASPFRFNLITTGAGGSAIAALMSVPGCSRTLLNAQVPYSNKISEMILDHVPHKMVSVETGRQLAQHAFHAAKAYVDTESTHSKHVVGVAATAAVQTDRTRRGADQVFVTTWSHAVVRDYACELSKEMSRAEQEHVVCSVILKAMADSAGISATVEAAPPQETSIGEFSDLPSPISSVLSGNVRCALFNRHGEVRMSLPPYTTESWDKDNTICLLYPGSFKPLHWGHTELARVAGIVMQRLQPQKRNVVITYEISASIVGKRDVCEEDFGERILQFTSQGKRVAITTARLFVEKAEMFPNHGLVVGIDTARRVIDKQYYNNDQDKMIEAMAAIDRCGCYFVVGGRKHGDTWDDLSCLDVPEPIKHMFCGINPADFRVDISSTEIRARRMSAGDLSDLQR